MAVMPQIDVEVKVDMAPVFEDIITNWDSPGGYRDAVIGFYTSAPSEGVKVHYVAGEQGGILSACCFPGLTPQEITALPRYLYMRGLAGFLTPNEIREWNDQCNREVEKLRKAKLAETPEPDAFDRLFEPREA
jgi:hypothetical protein